MDQRVAFATGVPPDIYAFHRSTRSSTLPFHTLADQYRMQFLGRAEGFHNRLNRPPTRPLCPVIPNNACHLCITAAAGTELAVTSSHELSDRMLLASCISHHVTGVYNPKAFVLHAALHRQAFAHCG